MGITSEKCEYKQNAKNARKTRENVLTQKGKCDIINKHSLRGQNEKRLKNIDFMRVLRLEEGEIS